MAEVETKVTYLEMTSPGELKAARVEGEGVSVLRVTACPAHFYRDLYRGVGRHYNWYLRYHWADNEVERHLRDPAISLYVMYVDGVVAGYAEMRRQEEDDSVEVCYFGLLPEFVGKGLGKHLLTEAVEAAWGMGPKRVWLHTCTLDHEAALPNYLARGFRVYKTEEKVEPVLEA